MKTKENARIGFLAFYWVSLVLVLAMETGSFAFFKNFDLLGEPVCVMTINFWVLLSYTCDALAVAVINKLKIDWKLRIALLIWLITAIITVSGYIFTHVFYWLCLSIIAFMVTYPLIYQHNRFKR